MSAVTQNQTGGWSQRHPTAMLAIAVSLLAFVSMLPFRGSVVSSGVHNRGGG